MHIKKIIGIFLISFATFAADFTIDVNPAANSVDDSKVSSISSSKISDLVSVLSNYLLKSDVPDCLAGQYLTKISNVYSCVALVSQDMNPVGTVITYASGSCPAGYLPADGASVSRTTYANLYTAIGNAHGTANGSSFNLPDYRGRFLRMVDGLAGRDPDKASRSSMNAGGSTGDLVGSVQGHAFQSHGHSVSDPGHAHTIKTTGSGDNTNMWHRYLNDIPLSTGDGSYTNNSTAGSAIFNATSNVTVTTPNSGTASTETRPLNANVNFCIKY